jgi:hypothetical protein
VSNHDIHIALIGGAQTDDSGKGIVRVSSSDVSRDRLRKLGPERGVEDTAIGHQ